MTGCSRCVCVCARGPPPTLLAALRACWMSWRMRLMFSEMLGICVEWFCSRSSFFISTGMVSPRECTGHMTRHMTWHIERYFSSLMTRVMMSSVLRFDYRTVSYSFYFLFIIYL